MPKIGQAPALTEQDWNSWLDFVLANRGPRLYMLIQLTGSLALRCSEAAMLRGEDFDLDNDPPQVKIPPESGRGKSPGTVPIDPEQAALIKKRSTEGLGSTMTKRVNKTHAKTTTEHFVLPSLGRCFKGRSSYQGEAPKQDHLTYHAVWFAISKLSDKMANEQPAKFEQWAKLRSHSGRATKITLMMGEGMSLAMTMRFARHAPGSIKTHLKYGQLTVAHVYRYLMAARAEMIMKTSVAAASAQPPAALKRKCIGLDGCSLLDLVGWFEKGYLSEEEFQRAKRALPVFAEAEQ